jgi:hypothetical protein
MDLPAGKHASPDPLRGSNALLERSFRTKREAGDWIAQHAAFAAGDAGAGRERRAAAAVKLRIPR